MNRMLSKDGPIPEDLVGTYRRFGPVGPVYMVVGVARQDEEGDVVMKVVLVESGEETEYRYSHILDDPKEV